MTRDDDPPPDSGAHIYRDDDYRRFREEYRLQTGRDPEAPRYLTGLAFAAFLLITLFGVALSCAPAGRL